MAEKISDNEVIADAIKHFLQGELKLDLSVISIGKAIKRAGVQKEALIKGLSAWLEEGGDEAMSVVGALLASMGAEKARQMCDDYIKDVEVEVVHDSPETTEQPS